MMMLLLPQVLYATLKDLLDPTQPLYTKYCVLKVGPPSAVCLLPC